MPGTAIWHMAWSDKDDAIDWQAYFHLRNRLVVAAMHWDGDVRGLVRSHLKATLKHLLCLEYSTVAIQNKAMDDFLAGPEHIFSILESALPEVHRIRREYPDAVVLPSATALPPPSGMAGASKTRRRRRPRPFGWSAGVLHNLTKADPAHHERPQLNVPTQDSRWFLLCKSTASPSPPPTAAAWCTASATGRRCSRCWARRCAGSASWPRRFDEMRRVYRDALPVLSSKQKWEAVLLPPTGAPWLTLRQPRARTRRWWPCSRRSPRARVSSRPRAPCRTSASTAPAGWRCRRWARCCSRSAARDVAAGRVRRVRRARRRGGDQARGARGRPHHPAVEVNVGTPSALSFPSAHATSTTAAAVLMAPLTGLPLPCCWCRRWRCPAWCLACTIPATC